MGELTRSIFSNELFDIDLGEPGNDQTSIYYVTLKRELTVREFISQWLKNEGEWGEFNVTDMSFEERIKRRKTMHFIAKLEYRYGKITSEPLPDYILDSKIKHVSGSGGWSYSCFTFEI